MNLVDMQHLESSELPTEVIWATSCNLCPDYFPYSEYKCLKTSGGFCNQLNEEVQSSNFKPRNCPNNGQTKLMAIKF